VFSFVLMILFQHRFFLPNHFVVNEQGVSAGDSGMMNQLPWHRIRRFHFGDRGGLLSTRISGRGFRGGTIVLFDGNADAATDAIQTGMRHWSTPTTEMQRVCSSDNPAHELPNGR